MKKYEEYSILSTAGHLDEEPNMTSETFNIFVVPFFEKSSFEMSYNAEVMTGKSVRIIEFATKHIF